jgi:transposase, IS5 family
MNYRKQYRGGNLFAAMDHQKEVSKREVGILKLRNLIDLEAFRPLLGEVTGHATKDWSKGGRAPFDPVFMLKVLVLQKYHNLSDEATELQMNVRIRFLTFLGLRLGDEIPDQNTIWDFKELIEKDGRDGSGKLFRFFQKMLDKKGLVA